MNLNTTQVAALKVAILAETDPTFVQLRTEGATGAMAEYYNADSTVVVWKTTTVVDDIMNAVTWANFTPTDTADGTATWTNRALACQGKQFNLQTMLSGRTTIASNRTNIRNGIQDALTNLPSGTGGATLGGGWNAAENAMKRFARLGETIFVTGGAGTNANPSSLVAEGTITDANVVLAINS